MDFQSYSNVIKTYESAAAEEDIKFGYQRYMESHAFGLQMTFTPIASTGMIAGSDSTQFQATVGQITSTSEMITTSADLGISDAQAPISYDSEEIGSTYSSPLSEISSDSDGCNPTEMDKKAVAGVGDSPGEDEDEMELDHFVAEKSCESDLFGDDVMEDSDESMEESQMGSERFKKYRRLVSYDERKMAILKVTEESLSAKRSRTISRINPFSGLRKTETGKILETSEFILDSDNSSTAVAINKSTGAQGSRPRTVAKAKDSTAGKKVDIALDKIATIRRPKSEATSIDNTVTASAVTEEDCPLPDESCSFCKDHYQECYAASISKQQLLDWINKRIVTIQNKTDLSGQSANTSCSQCFTRYKKACMFSFIDEARHPEDENIAGETFEAGLQMKDSRFEKLNEALSAQNAILESYSQIQLKNIKMFKTYTEAHYEMFNELLHKMLKEKS